MGMSEREQFIARLRFTPGEYRRLLALHKRIEFGDYASDRGSEHGDRLQRRATFALFLVQTHRLCECCTRTETGE